MPGSCPKHTRFTPRLRTVRHTPEESGSDPAQGILASRLTGASGAAATPSVLHWENHYSPKYEKCFVSGTLTISIKGGALFMTELRDAFERSTLFYSQYWYSGLNPRPLFPAIGDG